jgi:hypothetical protein
MTNENISFGLHKKRFANNPVGGKSLMDELVFLTNSHVRTSERFNTNIARLFSKDGVSLAFWVWGKKSCDVYATCYHCIKSTKWNDVVLFDCYNRWIAIIDTIKKDKNIIKDIAFIITKKDENNKPWKRIIIDQTKLDIGELVWGFRHMKQKGITPVIGEYLIGSKDMPLVNVGNNLDIKPVFKKQPYFNSIFLTSNVGKWSSGSPVFTKKWIRWILTSLNRDLSIPGCIWFGSYFTEWDELESEFDDIINNI